MTNTKLDPALLVDAAWLAAHLDDPNLRVFDTTTLLVPDPELEYRVEGDQAGWKAGHIPGAAYLNCQNDLSITPHEFRFTLPEPEDFATRVGALGIGDDTRLVLYSRTQPFWSTRAWWSFYAMGFERAMVLDGGYNSWVNAGHSVSTDPSPMAPASFTARPRRNVIYGKEDVLAVLDNPDVAVVNALSAEQFTGAGGMTFGRPGRITNSVNVPYAEVCDMATCIFSDAETLQAMFSDAGATPDRKIVNYCGGGISATLGFFAQKALGYKDVALYDASMQEWGKDDSLPMEKD
ncbi:MAG: sulfurtransferase [Alphaproteobacteria bacterium]|nr:sulfurtransferase [Alphaproteobacteria bacterium]